MSYALRGGRGGFPATITRTQELGNGVITQTCRSAAWRPRVGVSAVSWACASSGGPHACISHPSRGALGALAHVLYHHHISQAADISGQGCVRVLVVFKFYLFSVLIRAQCLAVSSLIGSLFWCLCLVGFPYMATFFIQYAVNNLDMYCSRNYTLIVVVVHLTPICTIIETIIVEMNQFGFIYFLCSC